MTLDAKVVTYTANTGTGDQQLTGNTFRPKAAIVYFTRGNNAADTFVESYSFGFGFTDGISSRCYFNVSEDAQATSDAARIARNDSIIVCLNLTGTLTTTDAQASFVRWNGDGMTINWSDAPAAAFKFHVLYLGGDDLIRAKVGDFTTSANGTNVPITGVGFRPNNVIAVTGHTTAFNTAVGDGASFNLGCYGSTRFDVSLGMDAGVVSEGARTTMDTWQLQNTGAGIIDLNATTGALFNISNITSMDGDGFSVTTSSFSVTTLRSYLALQGGSSFTNVLNEPGSTGLQTIERANEMKDGCRAVIIFGIDTATGGSIQVDNVFTFGVATAPNEQAVTVRADLDAAADSVTTTRYETDSVYLNITPNATATSSTVDDEATLANFTDSGFVLNWTNIGNARLVFYLALGNLPVQQPHSYGKIHSMFDNNQSGATFG